jgi:yecA family protein
LNKTTTPQTYQLRVSLDYSKPEIWRRLRVPSDTNLIALHQILQIAMGWEGYHLHEFIHNKRQYGPIEDEFSGNVEDEFDYELGDLLKREGDHLTYLYDFGDSWEHQVVLEKITPQRKGDDVAKCTTGARACPPEDVGGIPGYERLLAILQKPAHEEYEEMLEWLGDDYDPRAFDKAAINSDLEYLYTQQKIAEQFGDVLDELDMTSDDEEPSDTDIQLIDRYFPAGGRVGSKQPNYDCLHGYLTAIVCAPQLNAPIEWMGDLSEIYHLEQVPQQQFTALMLALFRLHNQLAIAHAEDSPYWPDPCDLETTPIGTTTIELWCDGFVHGFLLNEEDWLDIDDDAIEEEVGSCLAIISALAMREVDDKSLPPKELKVRMEIAQNHLRGAVLTLYDLARSEHYAHLNEFNDDDWPVAPPPVVSVKVGRNEPCPCGSGLKYKKCCIDKVVPLH